MAQPTAKLSSVAHSLGPLIIVILLVIFAQWTGDSQTSSAADAAWVLVHSCGLPLAWLAAAMGLGLPLRMLLLRNSRNGLTLQIVLGIAAMLWLDEVFGILGLMQLGGSIGAWLLITVGLALLAVQIAMMVKQRPKFDPPSWMIWTASPSIAVLLLAACSAPGWLWASEFGGYDALSYHLQLPKEWFALGRIAPLNHNVYSYFPGYVEAAYYHIAVLKGDAIDAVYSCQLLHAGMTIIAAVMIGRAASRMIQTAHGESDSPRPLVAALHGTIAVAIALGTPWVIVVGSLAYNEMAVVLMLAAGVLTLTNDSISPGCRGGLIGLFAAAACAAKLIALGLAAVPLAALLMTTIPLRAWSKAIAFGAIAGFIVLLPYLLRNWIFAGNPLFPFATGLFGLGHWIAEQAATFSHGHAADATLAQRFTELWNQFLRYGIGLNPNIDEPWKPQWSVLPWMGLSGLLLGLASRSCRAWSVRLLMVLAIQIAFWLFFTHLKSRFLVPAVVPLSIGAAIGVVILASRFVRSSSKSVIVSAILALGLCAWSFLPARIFRTEREGGPAAGVDMIRLFTGDELSAEKRAEWVTTFPMILINHAMPANAKVLFIGDATPLFVRDQSRINYQTTWDRGPLSRIMREHPDDPHAWVKSLRDLGFTHMLINPDMLARWERAGWNDPLITSLRVMNMAQAHARLVHRFPNGEAMYRLE